MADFFTVVADKYDHLMSKADPRHEQWFLMGSPLAGFCLTVSYIFIVKYLLPKYMENRKPYDMKIIMLLYNFTMVALSGYMCYEFGMSGWFTNYTFGCQLVDFSRSPQAMRMLSVCWWFYISKYIEFTDTFIFCLRKKYSQVTFLHVVHHTVMPYSCYFGLKFGGGGGMGTFHCLLNSFVHFFMYTYYGLTALGPEYEKYLWWKKYITKLQLVQFILDAIHSSQMLSKDCDYPKYFGYVIFSYSIFFLCIFAKFYIHAYIKGHRTKRQYVIGDGQNGSITDGDLKKTA